MQKRRKNTKLEHSDVVAAAATAVVEKNKNNFKRVIKHLLIYSNKSTNGIKSFTPHKKRCK